MADLGEIENVGVTIKDGKLTLVVDLKQELYESDSAKSMLIATTHGNVLLPETKDTYFSVNIYRRYPKKERRKGKRSA